MEEALNIKKENNKKDIYETLLSIKPIGCVCDYDTENETIKSLLLCDYKLQYYY